MFFEKISEITEIARRTGCAIFVVPEKMDFSLKNALVLAPEEKTVITIEQVRKITAGLSLKQTDDRFIIIRPAEKMGLDAANAFLKNLEEPSDKVHYILITDKPSLLLPTVLSRAQIYFLKTQPAITLGVEANEKVKGLAKKLMVAKPTELVAIAEEICKKKDGVRDYALSILGTAIEMLYKSYFLTEKEAFVKKLPNFLKAYENIERNGHIKLHLVADLV